MITATMVKELRDSTGLSMGDCKTALTKANGDQQLAIDILRQMGLSALRDAGSRMQKEGKIGCWSNGTQAGMIKLLCETEPVANTDDFINLANIIAKTASTIEDITVENLLVKKTQNNKTIQDEVLETFNKVKENISITNAISIHGNENNPVGFYLHHNGKVGVLIQMSQPSNDSVIKNVGMQIASMNPPYLNRESVPANYIENEKSYLMKGLESKPPQIIEKIINGKLNKWFAEKTLLEQTFVKDDKMSVQTMLTNINEGLTVLKYFRYFI